MALDRWLELVEEAALKEKIAHRRVLRNFLLTRDEMIVDPGREWDELAAYLRGREVAPIERWVRRLRTLAHNAEQTAEVMADEPDMQDAHRARAIELNEIADYLLVSPPAAAAPPRPNAPTRPHSGD